jgi:hypothetical protein
LERDSLSSEGFLRRGETKDSVNWIGKRPAAREWLIIESDSWDKKRGTFFEDGSMNGVKVTHFVRGLM